MFGLDIEKETCAVVDHAHGLSLIRAEARGFFKILGIREPVRTEIFTIINELGQNILRHAGGGGEICLSVLKTGKRTGIRIVARDSGPGIIDLEKALEPGFSEDKGLGLGMSAIGNLSDDVRISTLLPHGTQVEVIKWII
ncbi:MAG: ATP-binding protein [Dissulfurimicrobium sp.]|uniref:ATP-binding protein n=1 Tax=Dissulfurimicrobium TaxID=1769732 RepID=UPI001EDA8D49|nr:ATP-binding protein [Dissulfurimicrobium hydrothermale]UKL13771.1 ATP-binding protein [Dissulfurimicrobium hydrothermale]